MGGGHLKILIAEDEAAHAEAISRAFKGSGRPVEIRLAGTLLEYRRVAEEFGPDIALMDLNLPDGLALEALTGPPEESDFPIIIMTAYGNEQVAVEALKAGALDYVVKSPEAFTFTPRTVERALREWNLLHEHKRAEKAQQASLRFLKIMHNHTEISPLLKELAAAIKDYVGCDSVAIRVLDDAGNIPYHAYAGFSTKFIELESPLSVKSDQCMCINVIKGTTNPMMPFYTKGGSFYMNATTRFLATVSEDEKGKTRNVCNKEGYESVALVPFMSGGRILGLIHVADHRENMVPLKLVEQLEGVAIQLGAAFQRANAEAALRESEERYRTLFENSLDAVLLTIPDGRILSANPAACRMFGRTQAEICALGREGLVDTDDPRLGKMLEARALNGRASGELTFVRKDGSRFPGEMSSLIFQDSGGDPRSSMVIRDITERKLAEDALRKSEAKYRVLYESMRDAFVTVDMQGRITDFNRAYQLMLGYSPEELLELAYTDLTPGKWHAFEQRIVAEQVIQRGFSDVYEKEYRKKDGEVISVELRTILIRDEEGNPAAMWAIVRDVTERKKSEELLRGILENVDEGFIVVDRDYRIITANRAFNEKTGLLPEHIVGEHCYEISHHCDTPCHEAGHMCAVNQVFETGKPHAVVHTHHDGQGEPVCFETKAYPLSKDETGRVITVIEILVDITERKKAEDSLRDSEARYRHLFDNMLEGYAYCRMLYTGDTPDDFVYIHVNKAFEDLTGLKDVTGKKVGDVIPGIRETNPELFRIYGNVALTGKPERFETYVGSLDIWFSIAAYSTEKEHFVAVFDNITERKRAEEAVRASERQYRQLVDNALVGVYKTTLQGKFLYVNEALAGIFECESLDEMLQMPVGIRYKKPEDREAFLNILKERGRVSYYELEVPTKTGKLKTIAISAALEGSIISGMVIDITERKHLEAQLMHAQKMEAVGQLAGGVAHDFNNILNVILGYGAIVMDKLEEDSPLREEMNEVLAAADKAATLTKRLLVFSRKQIVDVKPVNISEIILGLQKMLVRLIGEDIDFVLDLPDRSLSVLADAGQLEQVLINLSTNARDAMPRGGKLTVGARLQEMDDEFVETHGYGKAGMHVLITVADTGHGMDAETQLKIFEPFFTTKGIGEGTGLGLAISYGIIKQHNGYMNVYSEPGQGTVFRIYLPLIEETAGKGRKVAAPDTVKGGDETILVAEDDASLRKMTKVVLESFGYSVITAEDGEEALAKFMENREKIMLAVLDVIMPKKNGKEVSDVIRKLNPEIKILFVSGYTMDTIKTRELRESGFEFMQKPVLPKELLKKVRGVLDAPGRAGEDENTRA